MADQLEDLLRACTVQISGGPMLGTGFFAAPGIVLTCAHVTGPGSDLKVHWERDDSPARVAAVSPPITRLADQGRPIPALDDYPDIAVLRVTGLDGHPCVNIDTAWPAERDAFLVFGYPREGGAIRLTPARLTYRGTNGTLPTAYLDLASDTIRPGMSGAAVLNMRTGTVCGVVVASRNTARPDGALAIPWTAVSRDIAEVLAANRDFQLTDPRWREARRAVEPEALAAQQARLQSYLTAARAGARQHPYTIGVAGAPALSTVYLRQQLGVQVDEAKPAGGGGGAAPIREPADGRVRYMDPNTGVTIDVIREALQRFDIDEVLRRNDGALIIGPPGSGKSSLMRHMIEVSADGWLGPARPEFAPVLVHARVLLGSLPLHETIADAVRRDLGARLGDVDLNALFAGPPMPGLPWLILLDGLDEIFEPERRQLVINVVGRWWDDPRYRFLITSRPLPERELHLLRSAGIPAYEIQAFADDQLPELARRWFNALAVRQAEDMVGRFIAQVRRTRMAHLARNPLIATISCVVFANHPDRELPYSRAELYEAFVALFLEKVFAEEEFLGSIKKRAGRHCPQGPQAVDALVADLRVLIQQLAVLRFTESERSLRADAERLAEEYRPAGVPHTDWQPVIGELLLQSGLISERAGDLAFNHETIIEYLAACARTMPALAGRLGARERWRLVTRAGSNESYALFVVALLRDRGSDLTARPPAVLQVRKLLHARLVAAVVHDGCALAPQTVTAAVRYLVKIATEKTTGIPDVLRRGIWWQDDDCVMAAKALTLIDKDQGLDLLFTLAADPTVPAFSVFDALAEVMVKEDLTEIDSARGLSVLFRIASAPSPSGVDRNEDSFNRMMIVDLILDHDLKLGADLLRMLARDTSMDLTDRFSCIERLIGMDRQSAIDALADGIADPGNSVQSALEIYAMLAELDTSAAVAALARTAADPVRGGYPRAVTGLVLYRDARPEGLRAFRELSADPDVPGFYRVFYFAEYGDPGTRANRLLELSRDATLPPDWRIFAAEELWEEQHEEGLEAFRAVQQDVPAGRRMRIELAVKTFAYARIAAGFGLLSRPWRSVMRLMAPEDLLSARDAAVPPSVRAYLLPDEQPVIVGRAHPAVLLPHLAVLLFGTIAAVALSSAFPRFPAIVIIWSVWILLLGNLIRAMGDWSARYILLTDQRLLAVRGFVTRKLNMIPTSKMDMYIERSLCGRILGYGTFDFRGPELRITYVPHPGLLYLNMLATAWRGESDD